MTGPDTRASALEPRRILLSIHSSHLGGAARTLLDLAVALQRRGHAIVLLWSGAPDDMRAAVARGWPEAAFPIVAIDLGSYSWRRPWLYPRVVLEYLRLVATWRPDAAIHRGHVAGKTLAWPSRLARLPSLTYMADVIQPTTTTRLMLAGSDYFAGSSRAAVAYLDAPGRRLVLHPSFDLRQVPGSGSSLPLAKGAQTLWLGSVGELVPPKGHRHLIEALSLIDRPACPLELVLVGDDRGQPGYSKELERLAAERGLLGRVHFVGYQIDVWSWHQAFDIYVQPSESTQNRSWVTESFGRVLVEAALCGVPLIGSAVGGIPEIIVHGENGLLVPPGEPRALAEAITRLVSDPALRKRMGDEARRSARARFGLEQLAARLEAFLEALITRDRATLDSLSF